MTLLEALEKFLDNIEDSPYSEFSNKLNIPQDYEPVAYGFCGEYSPKDHVALKCIAHHGSLDNGLEPTSWFEENDERLILKKKQKFAYNLED